MTEKSEEKKAVYLAAVAAEKAALAKTVTAVAATESGKELLKFLHRICGYDQTSLVLNRTTGEIDMAASTFNEVRRGVYLQLRPFVPVAVLRDIENPEEKK